MLSNPCNPTGKLVDGDEMSRWVATARELDCTLLLDEFYSHYIYRDATRRAAGRERRALRRRRRQGSGRALRRLTKNWRYPGWRVTWAVGPSSVVDALAQRGSFLDGGGSKPLQRAAIPLLDDEHVVKETLAIQNVFREKRDRMLSRLERLGVRFDRVPDGTFYCWGNVADLPPPLNDGMGFFRAALDAEGHHRARRVLRREPGQAPPQPRLALPPATCASRSARRRRPSTRRSSASLR